MSSEKQLWRYVRDGMKPLGWHCQRHEDKLAQGIPDVSYGIEGRSGWLELKVAEEVDANHVVKVPHFTTEQRMWMRSRWTHAPLVFMLLRVKSTFYLLDVDTALKIGTDEATMDFLKQNARAHWFSRIVFEELYESLQGV